MQPSSMEQGLGKTKIAIDLALLWLKSDAVDTVLVVTKKSLVENWCNEIARPLPHHAAHPVRQPSPEQCVP